MKVQRKAKVKTTGRARCNKRGQEVQRKERRGK